MNDEMSHRLPPLGSFCCSRIILRMRRNGVSPKQQVWYYHKELRQRIGRGRRKGCRKGQGMPVEFAAAEKMKNDAYEIYWACRTEEGIAKANEATASRMPLREESRSAGSGRATVSISANPASIEQGKCSTLAWSTAAPPAPRSIKASERRSQRSRQVCPAAPRSIRSARWAMAAPGRHRRRSSFRRRHPCRRRRRGEVHTPRGSAFHVR